MLLFLLQVDTALTKVNIASGMESHYCFQRHYRGSSVRIASLAGMEPEDRVDEENDRRGSLRA